MTLAIPKSNSKKEKRAKNERRFREREANRKLCLKLDGYKCRSPFCLCNKGDDFWGKRIESHHILGRSADNKFDDVEYRISLSARCHPLVEKNPTEMLRILVKLKQTASDFRWQLPLDELERKYFKGEI